MNHSIIMADNNLEFSGAVASILRRKNFDVKTISNGITAANNLNEEIGKIGRLPMVLIVDLSMPELDGLELLSRLAKEGNLCTVVAVSSHLEYFDLKSFLRTPLVGVLSKKDPETFVTELLTITHINYPKSPDTKKVATVDTLVADIRVDKKLCN